MIDAKVTGQFIAECRKEKKLTQKELGNRLGVTDRAVSKWETGRSFPDVAMLEPLSVQLEVSVGELLSGKRIEAEQYQKETEQILLDAVGVRQLYGIQIVMYLFLVVNITLVDLPFLIYKERFFPPLTPVTVLLWAMAVIMAVGITYLDKKLPERKLRTSNKGIEAAMGLGFFLFLMGINLVRAGGAGLIAELTVKEKIMELVVIVVAVIIVVGVRVIVADIHKDEWEMEHEPDHQQKKEI